MSYSIEAPFGPGDQAWYAEMTGREERVPCEDCEGSRRVRVVTRSGDFEVECQSCTRGYEVLGYTVRNWHEYAPRRITASAPHTDGDRIYYFDGVGVRSGSMLYTDKLSSTIEGCQAICDALNAEQKRYPSPDDDALRLGRGRTDAARKQNYARREIADAKRKLEYWESRLKVLTAKEKPQ